MSHLRSLAFVSVLAVSFLSGCTLPGNDGATSGTSGTATDAPTSAGVVVHDRSFSIKLTEFTGHSSPERSQGENFTWYVVQNGTQFQFKQKVDGSAVVSSDHIGGHMGKDASPSAKPDTTMYNVACDHQSGTLPGQFTITCRAPTSPGVYHIRGHARVTQASGNVEWWSDDFVFRVI